MIVLFHIWRGFSPVPSEYQALGVHAFDVVALVRAVVDP
jgi:hypothetical protein